MSQIVEVPAFITEEQADAVGCTPLRYARIVACARLLATPVKFEAKPEYPQHCSTPAKCIAAGRCTRDPCCID